jgi:hypothetical protein
MWQKARKNEIASHDHIRKSDAFSNYSYEGKKRKTSQDISLKLFSNLHKSIHGMVQNKSITDF